MFTLGADPELFLADAAGSYIASCGLFGGTKLMPSPMGIGDGFMLQEDNVALEFNIPPGDSKAQFVNAINRAMSHLSDLAAKHKLHLINKASAVFDESQLWHPLSREFGCDPDFDAWKNGEKNPKPSSANKYLRSCGGHVHVGYKFEQYDDIIRFIKYMDLFTIGAVILDNDTARRQLYGKPGAFRPKRYGCEYRSLSNFWVFDPAITGWVWDATSAAMNAWQNNSISIDELGSELQAVINNNDKTTARQFVDAYQLPMI
jgi:hypothetical protein